MSKLIKKKKKMVYIKNLMNPFYRSMGERNITPSTLPTSLVDSLDQTAQY